MTIRQAKIQDVKSIHLLVTEHAQKGELLPRPLSDLYEKVREFIVVEERGSIIACGALHVSWEDLAEVRTLIVSKNHQGKGIGAKIVNKLEKCAVKLGVKKVFALSFKPGFFKKIGYAEIKREILPHKVWRDCIKCPLFPDCGETALMKDIKHKTI
ncbi:MAG: GNAT family N-acetyltransferase [Elusimicrobia bacterium RIFOXYB2_FULL_48_7]|nr:MAG: GNAT family N-acetyltransferase [Elusimicrobia bacterium RIFOXYB2_FULL_48_7]